MTINFKLDLFKKLLIKSDQSRYLSLLFEALNFVKSQIMCVLGEKKCIVLSAFLYVLSMFCLI